MAMYRQLSAETRRLIQGQEGREVDFKAKSEAIQLEDFVALANGGGGTLLVGVAEVQLPNGIQTGKVIGCVVTDKARQAIINKAKECRPTIDILIRVENASTTKPIFRVDVPEGTSKPYCTPAGLYKIRADGQNLAIDPSLLKAIILEAEAEQFLSRFKVAADDLTQKLTEMHQQIGTQIDRVELVAQEATQAARDAENAAIEAGMWTQA